MRGVTLFALTFNEDAFALLQERCPQCLWFEDRDSCYNHIKSLPADTLGYKNSVVADLADLSNDMFWT